MKLKDATLMTIPGIGPMFVKDFARIDVYSMSDLIGRDPDQLYLELQKVNATVNHKTSKNYLYVFRMAVYYANGGRNQSMLKWNAWKDYHQVNQKVIDTKHPIPSTISNP